MGSIKHAKTSPVPNPLGDTRRVGGGDWNSEHIIDLEVADIDGLEARLIPVEQVEQFRDDALQFRNEAAGSASDAAASADEAAATVGSLAAPGGAELVGAGTEGTVQAALDGRVKQDDPDSSDQVLYTPTGGTTRPTKEKLDEFVSVLDFYLPADGADIAPAWDRALAASPYVRFPPPKAGLPYKFLSSPSRTLASDLVVDFGGNEVDFDGGKFRLQGQTIATGRTLAANAARYATSIQLNDATLIQSGDLIYINTTIPIESAFNYSKKDCVKVKSISGSVVQLAEPLEFPYTTADAGLTVAVYRPYKVTLLQPKFKLTTVSGQGMGELWFLDALDIRRPVAYGTVAGFDPATDVSRRMFQILGCWNTTISDAEVTALSYPFLVVGASRNTDVNGVQSRFCRHVVEPADWARGVRVTRQRSSDGYQSVSAHPASDVHYNDVVVERDSSLSNLRCVRGSLRNARIHTLADDATPLYSEGPYFQNLTLNPGYTSLYDDADLTFDNVEFITPNRALPIVGCSRARTLRVTGLKANDFVIPVAGGVTNFRWAANNELIAGGTPTLGATKIRNKIRTAENPLLPAYLDAGTYHIDARKTMVDQADKYARMYGPVVQGLVGAAGVGSIVSVRVHTHIFGSSESITGVRGVLKLKGFVQHNSTGLFSYVEKWFNFYHKVSSTSSVSWPTTPIFTSASSGQGNDVTMTLGNPTQAGVTELGGNADYWVQADITLTEGVGAPVFDLSYELELYRN